MFRSFSHVHHDVMNEPTECDKNHQNLICLRFQTYEATQQIVHQIRINVKHKMRTTEYETSRVTLKIEKHTMSKEAAELEAGQLGTQNQSLE